MTGARKPMMTGEEAHLLTADVALAFAEFLKSDEHIAQFFDFRHLPPHLGEVAKPFALLATAVFFEVPRNPERTVALRRLLEAKDCAVRATLAK